MADPYPFAISLDALPTIQRLAAAAATLLLDVDLDRIRSAAHLHVLEVVDRAALLELADALDALRGRHDGGRPHDD